MAYKSLLFHLGLLSRVGAVALPQAVTLQSNGIDDWLSPRYVFLYWDPISSIGNTLIPYFPSYVPFQAPLQIMPTAQPKATFTEPENGTVIDFFEIDIRQFTAQTVFDFPLLLQFTS